MRWSRGGSSLRRMRCGRRISTFEAAWLVAFGLKYAGSASAKTGIRIYLTSSNLFVSMTPRQLIFQAVNRYQPRQETTAMTYLRNAWYVAAWAGEVSSERPLGRTLLGKPVVMWRDNEGRCFAHLLTPESETRTHYWFAASKAKAIGEHGRAMADSEVEFFGGRLRPRTAHPGGAATSDGLYAVLGREAHIAHHRRRSSARPAVLDALIEVKRASARRLGFELPAHPTRKAIVHDHHSLWRSHVARPSCRLDAERATTSLRACADEFSRRQHPQARVPAHQPQW